MVFNLGFTGAVYNASDCVVNTVATPAGCCADGCCDNFYHASFTATVTGCGYAVTVYDGYGTDLHLFSSLCDAQAAFDADGYSLALYNVADGSVLRTTNLVW